MTEAQPERMTRPEWEAFHDRIMNLRQRTFPGFVNAYYGPAGNPGGLTAPQVEDVVREHRSFGTAPHAADTFDFIYEQFNGLCADFSAKMIDANPKVQISKYVASHILGSSLIGAGSEIMGIKGGVEGGMQRFPFRDLPGEPFVTFLETCAAGKPVEGYEMPKIPDELMPKAPAAAPTPPGMPGGGGSGGSGAKYRAPSVS